MGDEEWQGRITELALEKLKQQCQPKHYQVFDLYVLKKWPLQKVIDLLKVNRGQVYLIKRRLGAQFKREIKALESKLS